MIEIKTKILIGPSSFASLDSSPLKRLHEAGCEVIDNPYKRKLTKAELLELLPSVTGIIAGLEPLDKEVIDKSELKVISRCGSGMSNVDLEAAKERNIVVKRTPMAPVVAVAELTIGCILNLLRCVSQMNRALHRGQWDKKIGRELKGMSAVIVGFGNIGKRVGELLQAFGAKVIIVDPLYSSNNNEFLKTSLYEALPLADIILLHSSGEDCILGEKEFALMQDDVYIVNAARGGLIDEVALQKGLDSGKVSGAWLDTFQQEPYNGELCGYENVILTPHTGSYTLECRRSMEMEAVKNLLESISEE